MSTQHTCVRRAGILPAAVGHPGESGGPHVPAVRGGPVRGSPSSGASGAAGGTDWALHRVPAGGG